MTASRHCSPFVDYPSTTKKTDFKQSSNFVTMLIFSILGGGVMLLLIICGCCMWLRRKPSTNQRNIMATYNMVQLVQVDPDIYPEGNESSPSQSGTTGPIVEESTKDSDTKLKKSVQETSLDANKMEVPVL